VIVGYASGILDHKSVDIQFHQGMTMRDLFTELARIGRPGFREAIYDPKTDRLNEYLAVFVNSREIRSLSGLNTRLSAGDQITIMPPMAGGATGD
jgi:molybdopterin converting factor small subunit